MFDHYYHTLIILFKIVPYVPAVLIMLAVVSIIILIYICLGLFLDQTYRPNIAQYPFNIFLDRILPLIAMLTPTIVLLNISQEKLSWMEKFGYIILVHTFILTPMMYYWSGHRSWFQDNNLKHTYIAWNHPKLYYSLTISLIYPFVWGLYFSILRYLRLGQEISLEKLFTFLLDNNVIIVLIFINFLNITLWGFLLFRILVSFQKYLWNICSSMIFSLYLELLHYSFWFNFFEKIYKIHFIYFNVMSLNAPINITNDYKSYNIMRRIMHNIYYYPVIIYAVIFIILCLEILLSKKLFFIYYFLFWFPIMISFFKAFNTFGQTSFVKDVCMIDYFAQDLKKIRYRPVFWRYVEDPSSFYGHSIPLTPKQYDVWEQHYIKSRSKDFIYSYALIHRLVIKVARLQKKCPLNIYFYLLKIKVAYYATYKLRWNYKSKIEK